MTVAHVERSAIFFARRELLLTRAPQTCFNQRVVEATCFGDRLLSDVTNAGQRFALGYGDGRRGLLSSDRMPSRFGDTDVARSLNLRCRASGSQVDAVFPPRAPEKAAGMLKGSPNFWKESVTMAAAKKPAAKTAKPAAKTAKPAPSAKTKGPAKKGKK